MNLGDVINKNYLDAKLLNNSYISALPFQHIVMEDFINSDLLKTVVDEFPDKHTMNKRSCVEIKRASKGIRALTPTAVHLNSYMQSELMLDWLHDLTAISEPLISDPYFFGAGFHESQKGDVLKVHADFNKHPLLSLDRRINFLIYLNKNWEDDWCGALQLFDRSIKPIQTIFPRFNTAVVFSTSAFSYHGFPDPINCPENRSRQSLSYYYYSNGRTDQDRSLGEHSTLWIEREGEKFTNNMPLSASENFISNISLWSMVKDFTPPILFRGVNKLLGR